jgi:hypothetical protein
MDPTGSKSVEKHGGRGASPEPRGCVRLNVLLRGNEGRQDTELTLVKKKEDPLGPLEESPSPEAPSLRMWASTAVLSILHKIDDWRVDAGRISVKKIHKTPSSLTLRSDAS